MITLTAQMRIQGENPLPFTLGVSELGSGALFGETVDVEQIFDQRNLLSIESEVKDRSDIEQPSFGIISNGGSLSFNDSSSRFLEYANAGLLTEGIEIKIFLENTLTKSKKQVGLYYTTDWEYDNGNRSVSVSFKDNLEDLQNKMVLTKKTVVPNNMYAILQDLLQENLNIVSNFRFTEAAMSSLERTKCEYPILEEKKALWYHIDQICNICGLQMYIEKDEIVFSTDFDGRT